MSAIAVCLLTGPALGGGNGGAKKDATLRVVNDVANSVGVIIGKSNAELAAIQAAADPVAAWVAAGGKILNPGQRASFSVKAGTHRVTFANINAQGVPAAGADVQRSVGKGKTLEIRASAP
jgi:hypothetical protein